MTLEKLATIVAKEIRKNGFGTPPAMSEIHKVLKGLAMLTDEEADPDSIFSNKVRIVLQDVAYDVRLS